MDCVLGQNFMYKNFMWKIMQIYIPQFPVFFKCLDKYQIIINVDVP